jgi:crossover junction endodeoxyribonuclease RuvC
VFVLGIDPGLSRCGYGCVRRHGGRTTAVAIGVLRTPPTAEVPDRLGELQREIRTLLRELRPAVVAIEKVFFQANTSTAMSVAAASGVVMAEAVNAGCEVSLYTPNQVKEAVAGYGAASKEQMQRMVQTLLGLAAPPKPADAADAVALALCHLAVAPFQAATASAGRTAPAGVGAPGLARSPRLGPRAGEEASR